MINYSNKTNIAKCLTHWGANPVGLGVYEASDLCEVAVALGDEFDGGGLHEEGII